MLASDWLAQAENSPLPVGPGFRAEVAAFGVPRQGHLALPFDVIQYRPMGPTGSMHKLVDHRVAWAGRVCVVLATTSATVSAIIEAVRPGRGAPLSKLRTPRSRKRPPHKAAMRVLIPSSAAICCSAWNRQPPVFPYCRRSSNSFQCVADYFSEFAKLDSRVKTRRLPWRLVLFWLNSR